MSSRWLESLQRDRTGDLSLFSSVAGTRRSRIEHGQGSREGVGATEFCVWTEIHLWWTALWAGALSWCRIQLPERQSSGRHKEFYMELKVNTSVFTDNLKQLIIIIIIIIIIIEFLTSLLWLGNIHLSCDAVINRIRLGVLFVV